MHTIYRDYFKTNKQPPFDYYFFLNNHFKYFSKQAKKISPLWLESHNNIPHTNYKTEIKQN